MNLASLYILFNRFGHHLYTDTLPFPPFSSDFLCVSQGFLKEQNLQNDLFDSLFDGLQAMFLVVQQGLSHAGKAQNPVVVQFNLLLESRRIARELLVFNLQCSPEEEGSNSSTGTP